MHMCNFLQGKQFLKSLDLWIKIFGKLVFFIFGLFCVIFLGCIVGWETYVDLVLSS